MATQIRDPKHGCLQSKRQSHRSKTGHKIFRYTLSLDQNAHGFSYLKESVTSPLGGLADDSDDVPVGQQ